ncbi:DUF6508 domain-containing protein [Leucobacter ruminantium]|uniref:Uncharacterized protein n=1 Tax=Leucobacter ruminantium TaxID=1289170 RepID=A0A939LWS8_9MICO|nr:hypothetical protein [Leucobacter ruminantium]
MTEVTGAQMEALQRINTGIELLEAGYTVEWTSSRVTESGARTMSYPNYDKRLMEALWGASELVGTDYGYTERVDEVRELSVPEMTQSQLSTFLTWVQRGERFCDGFIDGFVKDGRVLQALRRAAELEGCTEQGFERAPSLGARRSEPDERGEPAGSRAKPVWGRAALLVFLGSLLLTYVGTASNVLPGAGWAIGLLVAMGGGVVFSIISLVRRERRGAAIATLVMSLGLPLAVFVGFAVFFTFFYVA